MYSMDILWNVNTVSGLTIQISMWIAELLSLAQSNAVNDGGVVEGIWEHGIFGRQHGLEEPGVGVETWTVKDCILAPMELRYTLL